MNKYKTLVSNTFLISIGIFGSKLLVFLMVRFYTGYLTPADYGTADLLTQTANLLIPLVSLGITDGVFRFALEGKGDHANVFTAGFYTVLAGACLLLAAVPVIERVSSTGGYGWLIAVLVSSSCFHGLCAQFVRAQGNTVLFAVQGLVNTGLVIALNLLFLAVFSLGITGYVLSVAVANLLTVALLVWNARLWRQLVPRPPKGLLGEMFRYKEDPNMIQTAFNGLCMALADSVPGVSGGTIAFILGFYDRFIDTLHHVFRKDKAPRASALRYLLNLGLGWGLGMGVCVLLLSSLFTKNIYFMSSLFLGLTVASIPFILVAEQAVLRGKGKNLPFALAGAALVIALSLLRGGQGSLGGIDFLHLTPLSFLYIFLSGMVAIAAMVLPGISGSTILLIAGVYLPTINAIKEILHIHLAQLPGLMALGFGVLFGTALSIHFIRALLKKHRSKMVYLILGLMVGSLFAIVMGPTTLSQPLPPLGFSSFHFLGFAVGILVLLGLEFLRKERSGKAPAGCSNIRKPS